jgi:tetratricopeptide (TPR) repeat protein
VERYQAGAYAEAESIFTELLTYDGDNPAALRMLGLVRLRLGQTEAALTALEAAHKRAPNDANIQLHYGLGLHAARRYADAAAQFRASAQILTADPAPYLNLSSALFELGDIAGALDAAKRARRRAPQLAQASYTVGIALMAADRLNEARQAFEEALRIDPNHADSWLNVGVSWYRQNNIGNAIAAMRRTLAVAPDHAGAAANLGAFLRLNGATEQGEALLDEFLKRNPNAAQVRINQAVALLSEGRPADALALLETALPPKEPEAANHWQLQRAAALLQLGRANEARIALAQCTALPAHMAPLMHWREVLFARARRDDSAAREHAGTLEDALEREGRLLPEHRIMAHFDLARFWATQNEPDRTFRHWTTGHRLLARFQPFSRERDLAMFDAIVRHFDRARLHDGPRAHNRDPAPVFVVGMPRSGTTLVEQIIAAHPQAHGAGERIALSEVFEKLGGETPGGVARVAACDAAALDEAAEHYLAALHELAPDKARVVDKMPGNYVYLGLAALMLPKARIIHCVRDPRDVGLSIFTFRFYGYHPYAHDLGDLGWYIGQHDRLMAHWRENLPNPILSVALTDWIDDFDTTLRRVLDFIALPYDPACERFYESNSRVMTVSRLQVKQPINARGIGRWRRYEEQLKPLIEALEAGGAVLPP